MFLNLTEKQTGENSRNYIYRSLRENILSLYLEPGRSISETEFTSLFDVSRTPIREAFIKLSEEHLVDIFPQRGTYVTPIDMNLAYEGIFMRNCLEKAVLTEASRSFEREYLIELKKNFSYQKSLYEIEYSAPEFFKLDTKFHKLIFTGCNKERIWDKIDNMNTHYNRLRMMDLTGKLNIDRILKQHNEIIEVIEKHQTNKIDKLIEEHLTNIIGKMDTVRNKFPSYFTPLQK